MLLASDVLPNYLTIVWVILAMVGGRTAAMCLNRIIDADIDKLNPRTAQRAIPAGNIKKISAMVLTFLSFTLMTFATWQLPLICKQLLPLAIFILVIYSFTKRFTHLSHLVLGAALGAAASGGWLAVSGQITLPVIFLGLAIMFWVAGFDIIYALQDIDFDKEHKLFSIPALLGIKKSLLISRLFHLLTFLFLAAIGFIIKVNIFYWIGVFFVATMLIYEQSLIKHNDLSKVNQAFFMVNGIVSIGMFACILIDKIYMLML